MGDLFKNIYKKDNAVKMINESALNKFSKIRFEELSTNNLVGKYKLVFSFGIYDNVSLLCNQSSFYLKEFEFNEQAKSFKIVQTVLDLKYNKVPFLKYWSF